MVPLDIALRLPARSPREKGTPRIVLDISGGLLESDIVRGPENIGKEEVTRSLP